MKSTDFDQPQAGELGESFTLATIHDPERAAFWGPIFPDGIPITNIIPTLQNLQGFKEPQPAYMLDLNKITDDQRRKLIGKLARKFHHSFRFVDENLRAFGVPILADQVGVSSNDRGLLMSAVIDAEELSEMED